MIKVLFVCHGNICRSTMSQSVFTYLVRQAGLEDCFEIDSAATSREEIGNPPHYGTRNKLRQVQIPLIAHHARQMTRQDYENFDFLMRIMRRRISCQRHVTWQIRGIQGILMQLTMIFCVDAGDF